LQEAAEVMQAAAERANWHVSTLYQQYQQHSNQQQQQHVGSWSVALPQVLVTASACQ